MKLTVEEYNDIIKGLKEEINKLQSHLISEELSIPYGTQGIELQSFIAPVRTPEYSLQLEIEEIQQKSDVASDNLPTPLCGTLPLHDPARLIKDMYQKCSQRNLVDFQGITEQLLMQQDIEEETKELLQKISCLFYTKIIWDMYNGNLAPQLTAVMQRHQSMEMDSYTRNGVKKDNDHPAAEYVKAEPHLRHKRAEMKVVSGATRMVECGTSPEHYNLHVDQSNQREHNTRCATSSETMQVQRACQGLCDNIDHQQSKLELRFEELFSSEQKREGNICIKWNMMQTEFAATAADVKQEDQPDSSIWFCSQTKNLCLVSFLLFFTLMLVAYSSFFSFFPGCCQRYSSAECTGSSFWSLLKALLCPQMRLRHGAPPPV
ncbi:uncharacterized protein [Hemitrygon akajei]|uniref:uncharacterized protein n=1 Tax=Hemitrygon akajei TaxID=2704970 RepID=UPI003BFA07BF